ncbi:MULTISPECIES: Dabb family protein [unclassified Streptomyces]|uniref:Dabb family protein n=1 Tax=unclassified Streptomyces TaxID=2593676 RepID=UPI00380EABA6
MIQHVIRFTVKPDVTGKQLDELLTSLREHAQEVPAVESVFVGREHGGDYTWSATVVLADLDAYWAYLTHPAHLRTDRLGWPLLETFAMFDVVDDPDPEIGSRIAALHQRRLDENPGLADVISDAGRPNG